MKRPLQRLVAWIGGGLVGAMAAAGCWHAPSAHTISRDYRFGDAPVDPPDDCEHGKFDDRARGGQLFKYYCGTCHNPRALGERPFSNYQVAMAHMREQAYLTGAEYRELVHFLRRWHDVGPPSPDVEPSPKRFFYSQPISELRPKQQKPSASTPPAPDGPQKQEVNTPTALGPEITWYPPRSGSEAPRAP